MGDNSAIEWTDATWNPVTGCSKVSPGCAHCYAEALSLRWGRSAKPWTPENAAENVVLHPERLDVPLKWKTPRMVFVNSMSDLFHENIPLTFIRDVFWRMQLAERHTFQVLTKRPERAATIVADYMSRHELVAPLPNVWIGTSIENARFNWRADELRDVPAAIRFISAEPLLGPLLNVFGRDLSLDHIDWMIVGGESGNGFRPMDLQDARDLRDACQEHGVAFFFKQVGGRTPKAGGKLLDGREWCEMPNTQAVAV